MTPFQRLENRLLRRAGIAPNEFDELRQSEWSFTFEHLMRNRLVMGAMRYGKIHAEGKPRYDRIKGALKRLRQYQATGNLEALVDVANLMLLEFEEGRQHQHFTPLHDDHVV